MKKLVIALVATVAILVGGFFWLNSYIYNEKQADPTPSNSQMLRTEGGLDVKGAEVAYFENAKGYYVRPNDKKAYPGVVMIHENRGLRPEIRTMAEELAAQGYAVLAVDLFEGKVVQEQAEARALTSSFDQKKGVENMRAAVAYLKGQGATKIASLGWCFGGKQSVELAISGERLDATVVYYGGGMATAPDKLAPIMWPVLGIFGDKDQVISVDTVRTFEKSLSTLGIRNEIHIYPGVGHAFANPSGANYAPNETKDAWQKTLDFLKKTLR